VNPQSESRNANKDSRTTEGDADESGKVASSALGAHSSTPKARKQE